MDVTDLMVSTDLTGTVGIRTVGAVLEAWAVDDEVTFLSIIIKLSKTRSLYSKQLPKVTSVFCIYHN